MDWEKELDLVIKQIDWRCMLENALIYIQFLNGVK